MTEEKQQPIIPSIETKLKHNLVRMPEAIGKASGFCVRGRKMKSFLFSTDVAIIRNTNADAIFAVYPFTPELSIIKAILSVAEVPVFVGVGGALTTGERSVHVALQAELNGALGVVVNAPMPAEMIGRIAEVIDIPVVATIASEEDDIYGKVKAGAQILNVSGGKNTAALIEYCRSLVGEDFPILATSGSTEEAIYSAIDAGANALTYTPPSTAELVREMMAKNRKEDDHES